MSVDSHNTVNTIFGPKKVVAREESEDVQSPRKRFGFGDFLPDINQHKNNLLRVHPDAEVDYVPFLVNKAMSMHMDTAMLANEMNKIPHAPKTAQYDFYIHSVRSGRRFGWHKKSDDTQIREVMTFFNYSYQKAVEALSILTPDDIKLIQKTIDKGGIK